MVNQPSAIALGITTGYGEYYHTLPDSAVEVLRRIETNHGIDSSIDALFDDQDLDSDESNPGAQMNDEGPEYSTEVLNPSNAACGDLPPDTPVEFRLMSVLTEEMKIQSPGIPNIDSGARFTPEGGDVNPAETNGPTDVPIEKAIHDHQRSMSLAEDSPNAVFDLPEPQQPEPQQHAEDRGDIQSTQKPVDQCYFTSYQNTHDKHFSQEVVFGEEDFKFFDINMMAENMGPSENMEAKGLQSALDEFGKPSTQHQPVQSFYLQPDHQMNLQSPQLSQQLMFLCSPSDCRNTYLFTNYSEQVCTELGQTVLPVPSHQEISEWTGYLDAVQQGVVTFDPNYWSDNNIRIQLYSWFHGIKDGSRNSDGGFTPDSSATSMSPDFPPGIFMDGIMGSDMDRPANLTSTTLTPSPVASPAQFTDGMMGNDMASPVTSTSIHPITPPTQRPACRNTGKELVSKSTDVDLDTLLDHLPKGLLGDVSQAKEIRMISLREIYYRRMSQQGPCQEKMCHCCYHPGHDDSTDQKYCPVARLLTYINDVIDAPYTVGSNGMLSNIDMFFVDTTLIRLGYEWALATFKEGDATTFGITVAAVKALETVIERCDQIEDEGLILKDTGLEGDDLSGDFIFGDAKVGVEDTLPDGVDIALNGDVPESFMLHGIGEASDPSPKPKRIRSSSSAAKRPDICDIFQLQPLGTRVNSVCNQCYYRGHVINSTKTCPTSILLECLQRADSGRSWAHDTIKYCTAADHLRTVTNHLKDANDPRYERLENLIKDFDEIRESPSSTPLKRKGSAPNSSSGAKRHRSLPMSTPPTPSVSDAEFTKALEVIPFGSHVYEFLTSVAHDAPLASLVMKQNYIQMVPITGGRADTQCPNCHHFGHDQRAKVCPLLSLRDTLASGDITTAITAITSLSNVARWYAGLPSAFSGYKKDTSAIIALFSEVRERLGLAKIKSLVPQKIAGGNASGEQRWTVLVDVIRMDSELLNELAEYMLPDDVPAGVGIDHRLLPPSLFRKVVPYMIKR